VAVGVIKATTPKEAAGVTTKAAQKVIFFLSSCDAVLLVNYLPVFWIHDILVHTRFGTNPFKTDATIFIGLKIKFL
jgi:hypothetical protein